MSRINVCPACQLYNRGGKSRIAIEHTCGQGEAIKPMVDHLAVKAREMVAEFREKILTENQRYCKHVSPSPLSLLLAQRMAKECATLAVEKVISIQEDFYGLVLTTAFRDRCRARVEELEKLKMKIKFL